MGPKLKGKKQGAGETVACLLGENGVGATKARSCEAKPEPMLEKLLLNVLVKPPVDQFEKRVLLFDTDVATT